jgi:fibronectin-binding autotransporter adhesin
MAIILAAATGNWSATGTWIGGVLPVAEDVAVANNRTITIDPLTVTATELRNDTTGGATAGGGFSLVSGGTVNANVFAGSTATSCVTWAGSAGQTATITGQFFGGTGSGHAVNCTSGNLTCGAGSQTFGGTGSGSSVGLNFASAGTLNFATSGSPGVIAAGTSSGSAAHGLIGAITSSTINIFASTIRATTLGGNSRGLELSGANQTAALVVANVGSSNQIGSAMRLAGLNASYTLTVSGNIQGGSGSSAHGISIEGTGTYNLTAGGNIIGGTGSNSAGLSNTTTATVNITGNITNTVPSGNGNNVSIANGGAGTVNVTGIVTAGNAQHAIVNASTGIVRVTRARGNGFGLGSTGINNVQALVSSVSGSLSYVEEIEFGSLGNTPVSGPIRFTALASNACVVTTTTGTFKTLVDTAATSGVLPAVTDVRSGVVYSSGNLTGTCAVPAAGSVALGVAVGNTVGTAILTAANVRAAVGMANANLDTQLARLANAATTQEVADIVEGALV